MKEKDFLSAQEKGFITENRTIENTLSALKELPVRTVLEPIDNYNYRTYFKKDGDGDDSVRKLVFCDTIAHYLGMPHGLDEAFTFGDCSSVMETGTCDRVNTPYIDEIAITPKILSNVSLVLSVLAAYHRGFIKNDTFEEKHAQAAPLQEAASDKALRQKQQHEFYKKLMAQMSRSSSPRSILDLFFRIRIKDYENFLDTLPFFKLLPGGARVLFNDMKMIAEQNNCSVNDDLTVGTMFYIALNTGGNCDVARELLLGPLFALKYRSRYDYR